MRNKHTILVIDDDVNNLRILKLDLEEIYNVLTAEDGAEGWKILEEYVQDINVILLDRMMSNMDGMQFIEQIKRDDKFLGIPVIMQTAAAEKEQIAEAIRIGVYYYLTKPYEKEKMLSVVAAAINEYIKFNK